MREVRIIGVTLPKTAAPTTSPHCGFHIGSDGPGLIGAPSSFHVIAHIENGSCVAHLEINEAAQAAPRVGTDIHMQGGHF